MHFGTFLDQEGYWIDSVHFPPSAKAFPFSGPGCYRLIGKVHEEFDFVYVDVSHLYRLPNLNRDDDMKPENMELYGPRRPQIEQRGGPRKGMKPA